MLELPHLRLGGYHRSVNQSNENDNVYIKRW